MTALFDNADTFLNANTDLFDGLEESDLLIAEKLIFTKGERILGIILDMASVDKIGAVKLEVKIENTDHAGKLHDMAVFKPREYEGKISPQSKKNWVEFLLAFFTKEEILTKQIDFSKHIGARVEFIAGEAKEKGDKVYQNFNRFKLITDNTEVTAF